MNYRQSAIALVVALYAFVLVIIVLAGSARANPVSTKAILCGDRDKIVRILDEKHNEFLSGMGVSKGGKTVFELFISESGTWSILQTLPAGRSCVMAVGNSWHEIKQEPDSY